MARHTKGVGVGVNLVRIEPVREKLIAEIIEYQRQQVGLEVDPAGVNFGMIQVYKELIQARQSMLDKLPPAL
ncbi:hypothetical protein [Cellvibrio polysaccharolyticus]|uniref:Uncharacterized protein n=1 Tax=Cellvibrio polysaccharolyticus TaxID=2082724 RepID=A0A928V535_9GAMM|nr:hypothetical protein [Cellvibrio polysaccharolyticus]MBE8718943.1 hypothetical protein [Cellvibrio polysaccharolyticus]